MRKIVVLFSIVILCSSCDFIVGGIKSIKGTEKENQKKKESKKEQASSKPGVKNGEKRFYYENGSLKSIVNYKDNKKVGTSHTFYKSGEKQYDIPYLEGKKHGKVLWYYKSGKVYRETEYKNGKKDGYQRKYRESGELKSEMLFKENMMSVGLKEIGNTGIVKSTPHIVVQRINRIKETGEYVVKFSLSNSHKKVNFYFGKLIEGKYFPVNGNGFLELPTKNGVAEYRFRLNKGTQIIKDIHVVAIELTSYQNKRVLTTKVPISVRNTQ